MKVECICGHWHPIVWFRQGTSHIHAPVKPYVIPTKEPGEAYFDKDGTLRNPDGSRSIFDDVDQ